MNAANPVVHFEPNLSALLSHGWNFEIVNRVRVNNAGFVNDQDYDPQASQPLLALLGDSYVEAELVPATRTVAGRLREALAGSARIYPFGVSGAPMSQYLVFAEYARESFGPDAMLFVFAGNDFDESLLKYKSSPGFHYFVEEDGGKLALRRVDFSSSLARRTLRRSALVRYLLSNLEIGAAPRRLRARLSGSPPGYVGNSSAEADPQRLADSRRAVDAFLEELPERSGLAPPQILFAVDGMRPDLYDPARLARARESFVGIMRDYLSDAARARGYEVVDLQEVFVEEHARSGRRFEWESENHWNELGHEVVFRAVLASDFFERFAGSLGARPRMLPRKRPKGARSEAQPSEAGWAGLRPARDHKAC